MTQEFAIALFRDDFDNRVDGTAAEPWDGLVAFFAEHPIAKSKNGLCFVPARYKTVEEGAEPAKVPGHDVLIPNTVGRKKANVLHVSCLVLDYDGGATIGDVREQLAGLAVAGYTSFNHLRDGATSKFRIVVPLSNPCPAADWEARRPALREMFPGADPRSFDLGRVFFTPRTDGTLPVENWHAGGDSFDWTAIEPTIEVVRERSATVREHTAEFKDATLQQAAKCDWSDRQDWLAWGGRLYDAGYDLADYERLSEADRESQTTCKQWWKSLEKKAAPAGVGRLIARIRREFPDWSPPVEPALVFVKGEQKPPEEFETIKLPKLREFFPCTPANERRKLVRRFVSRMLANWQNHGVLRTPEGYGKSTTIVDELLTRGKDVLFCCLSHKQVVEKLADFAFHDPVRVWSTAAIIETELGIKAVMKSQAETDWRDPGMDIDATADAIAEKLACTVDEAKLAIEEAKERAAESRRSKAKLLITTFATGDALFRMNGGSLDRIVVVDDPSMSDLITTKFAFQKVVLENEMEIQTRSIVPIATRPVEEVIFGQEYAFQDKVIWTTTEQNVTQCLRRQHRTAMVTDIVESLDTDARVHMIPTHLVRKATKKILPGILRAVEDDTHTDLAFIANGVKGELNLVNTKGRNDLARHTVIAISYPHPCDVAAVCDALGVGLEAQGEVRKQMVTDVLDQAIGRAQGYRGHLGAGGHRTLVIVDKDFADALVNRSRYDLRGAEGRQRRGRFRGVPLTWHIEFPEWWTAWFAYLNTWEQYVMVDNVGRVYELLSLKVIGMAADEKKLIERRLKKPAEFAQLLWKAHTEVVEGDDGRRNFSAKLSELVDQFNENRKATPKIGKRKYWKPSNPGQKPKMIDPANVPPGWEPMPKKASTREGRGTATGGSRGRPKTK